VTRHGGDSLRTFVLLYSREKATEPLVRKIKQEKELQFKRREAEIRRMVKARN
jgi:hypothetical protein